MEKETSKENKHQKHPPLKKPQLGEYHRVEFSILGAPCSEIQQKVKQLVPLLKPLRAAYIDADHASADEAENPEFTTWTSLIDKITYRNIQSFGEYNRFDRLSWFNDLDLVLVNGNHYKAQNQIVVVHPGKIESLKRKLDRLDDVKLILLSAGITQVPEFLQISLGSKWNTIPVGDWDDTKPILNLIQERLASPKLKGLVLAGGKSSRMGTDKTVMEFHGKPQREFLLDLLATKCDEVYLSIRQDQKEIQNDFNCLPDRFEGLGPYGAILSAFQSDPDSAWLVVASDLPLFDENALNELLQARNTGKCATAFRSPVYGFPEPLVAIWEPRSYYHLLRFLGLGYSCPRKVLINTDTHIIDAQDTRVLKNANTREELREIVRIIENRH